MAGLCRAESDKQIFLTCCPIDGVNDDYNLGCDCSRTGRMEVEQDVLCGDPVAVCNSDHRQKAGDIEPFLGQQKFTQTSSSKVCAHKAVKILILKAVRASFD